MPGGGRGGEGREGEGERGRARELWRCGVVGLRALCCVLVFSSLVSLGSWVWEFGRVDKNADGRLHADDELFLVSHAMS